jgi:hypothetical protein
LRAISSGVAWLGYPRSVVRAAPWPATVLAACLALVGPAACTLPKVGLGPPGDDGGTPDADAAGDAPSEASIVCTTGLACNGACIDAGDCTGCSGAPLLCAALNACTGDCSGCAGPSGNAMPIGCVACDVDHQNPFGTCQRDDPTTYCLNGDYTTAGPGGAAGFHCACTAAGDCPGSNQVCAPTPNGLSFCFSCGEPFSLSGQSCKGGGHCDTPSAACH